MRIWSVLCRRYFTPFPGTTPFLGSREIGPTGSFPTCHLGALYCTVGLLYRFCCSVHVASCSEVHVYLYPSMQHRTEIQFIFMFYILLSDCFLLMWLSPCMRNFEFLAVFESVLTMNQPFIHIVRSFRLLRGERRVFVVFSDRFMSIDHWLVYVNRGTPPRGLLI